MIVLATREREVLTLVASGLTNKEIAVRLYMAVQTVETTRKNINRRAGTRNGCEAAYLFGRGELR